VDVILPCLDEASALPWVLKRMPAGFRAIVVDKRSTDGSEALARSLGATVVREPRRGFGAAAHAGLLAATADLVCFLSASAAGWRVTEVEVAYLPRIGKSKVTGTIRDSVRTVRDMSRVLAR
jgi:hypothetical protein